jgi:UPF0755 protein
VRPGGSKAERRPPLRSWKRRAASALVGSVVVAGCVVTLAWAAWRYETHVTRIPAGAAPVRIVVPPGATAESIGRQLHAAGLVPHPMLFRQLVRWRGLAGRLQAGEYAFDGPLSLEGILDVLARGAVVRREITVPEGRCLEEIAALVAGQGLDADAFRAAARDPAPIRDLDPVATDLEGYLFPDTYDLPQTPEAPRVLVHRMTRRFREVITPDLPRIEAQGLTVRQVITLASIVELETAQAAERPLIAAVFLNRLERGMLLQTDPSIIYALRQAGRWDGNIRRKDLEIDSPYNTYRRPGLPPGPIGSPGREAILAVLDPAETRALYFVSRNDGTHEFSDTLVDHNRAVDRYQRRRAPS